MFARGWIVALSVLLAGTLPAGAQDRAQDSAAPQPAGPRLERANLVRPTAQVPPEAFPVASDARLAGDSTRTRLVMDLSRTIEIAAFTLADPYRVVIDLPQVTFQMPPRTGEQTRGLVKAFRFGLVMQGGSRVVIDTTGPVRLDKAFVLDAVDNQPARLVIDLVTTDRASFMRNLALEKPPVREAKKPEREAARSQDDGRPLVVIDPGHGGPDTGTIAASGEMEKNIVLEFAQALAEKLEKRGKYRVLMTRTDDRFVPLSERVHFARHEGAALFVSIHADALAAKSEADVRGATVYTLSESASDDEAARLAEDENKADAIAGVDLSAEPEEVAGILVDLAQRETKNFSHHFARTLVGALKSTTRLHPHSLKSAGFKVLKAPDVPSVLVELGYVSNQQDLKLMTSDAWRSRTSEAIAHAVNAYFSTRLAGSGPPRGAN
ncbi:MAG TPA: N-acetylmuramoyl-L-alanine amidase [Xanthobacteraceae bacterium]|nr:N-acetylmuramoyl-L-alanine amidase [Xanthobacteraceae bacterium]